MSLQDFEAAHLRGCLWLGTQSINPSYFRTEGALFFLFAFFLVNFFRLFVLANGKRLRILDFYFLSEART